MVSKIWHKLSEVPGQDLMEVPCIMKRVKVDEKSVMSRMDYLSLDLCGCLTVLGARVIKCVTALPTFTVMLNIEDE